MGHLNNAYVGLALMPESGDGSKTVTLKRYGDYEVRMIDFSQGRSSADCLFWLELYCPYDTGPKSNATITLLRQGFSPPLTADTFS